MMKIEFCVQNIEEIKIAEQYGVDRIELCSALQVGGLTPSIGMVRQAISIAQQIETHPIIRPVSGGFDYTDGLIDVMRDDIISFAEAGVKGVVFGVLNSQNEIDIEKNKLLIQTAKDRGLEITFHRAFDIVRNPIDALEILQELGVDRILTSGQQTTAVQGIDNIIKWIDKAKQSIQMMAGSGINSTNIEDIINANVDAVHFTISKRKQYSDKIDMGDAYEIDIDKIEGILSKIRTHL